ncbi:hypothetical protein B9Z55_027153 [Caenorhabditis nigoni]|uniref:F-box domain-containing protein n=1 Tax=Caenorhabditis nigoni TaxID=1611254 RepID=A0A2G5SGU5_9PELO|nr:hypothetical protein B9Z55_027153 [Caenorhabditis nigoni]
MPISLLKFPTDLLREVFKLCDPFELYKLSKCSKRTQRFIMLGGTKNWKIYYTGGNSMIILVDCWYYNFMGTNNPEEHFETHHYGSIHLMHIECPNGNAVDLFVHLIDTFGIRFVKSFETMSDKFDNVSKVAQVFVDKNMEIVQFEIRNFDEVQDVANFMPIMKQMNITKRFSCHQKFPPNFQHQWIKYPKEIDIGESFWFTIDQLLNCTCVEIKLDKSSLNNHDLNVFLQKWKKTGEFPNLRSLKVRSENIDNQSPILEMIPPIVDVKNQRVSALIYNDFYIRMIDAVRVTKDDGTGGRLRVDVGDWPELNFLIANPADEDDNW